MYPLTACGFVCAAVAILLQLDARRAVPGAGRALALATLALGAGGVVMRAADWAPAPLSLGIGAASTPGACRRR